MHKLFTGAGLLFSVSLFPTIQPQAQCNVNDKYDKIISGYHSSIALKDNGTYAVWGSSMQSNGSNDQLAPQDINATNYSGLTGTIYKAALGGQSAAAAVDQAILLTSDGLWAWGVIGKVLKTTIKASAAFGRITSPTGGVGSTTLGLPTGVAPTDVESMFATYQTLIILTKIVSGVGGNVYILTQASLAAEANGGTPVGNAGSASWKQVLTAAATPLTNVTAVRGQVYNATNNAFMAVTSNGKVYTWGNTSYLGNASAISARNYATSMTLPQESSADITPKMIGVTGGGGTNTTNATNTYYILSTTGNMYSLGNNTYRQCGDFTTAEKTSWARVKKSSAVNDYLTNINFFSCQEHDASFPVVAAITSTGGLYTWGHNSSGMAGRTDNGTPSGTLNTVSFDPGTPVGFTGTAVSVEVGGHTMVYLKEGSSQFCYVGHYTNGSMGDGTSGNNGSSTATSLKHDCNSTPVIALCGSVPVSGDGGLSTILATPNSIAADGSSMAVITIQLKNASGVNLTTSGGVVTANASAGTLGSVVDNNNGTYTVTLTSNTSVTTSTISFAINGTSATATAQVMFTAPLPLTWQNVVVYRQDKTIKVSWATAQEINVSHFEVERSLNGTSWQVIIASIPAQNKPTTNQYLQTDNQYMQQRVFYRIKQYDLDGKYTYSPVKMVLAEMSSDKAVLYPIPVVTGFQLGNVIPDKVKQVSLYTVDGMLLKKWMKFQSYYDIQDIAADMYLLRIEMTDGVTQNLKLLKR